MTDPGQISDPRIDAFFPGGDLVVDLGCGGGQWAERAVTRYGKVVGIDTQNRRELGPGPVEGWEFRQADLNQGVPLPDACADAVRANQVIEHVANPLHFTLEAHRILRPGGVFVAATPNIRYLPHVVRLLVKGSGPITSGTANRTPDEWDEGHIHFLTTRDLEWLARESGFSEFRSQALIDPTGKLGFLRRAGNEARRRELVKGFLAGNIMLAAWK